MFIYNKHTFSMIPKTRWQIDLWKNRSPNYDIINSEKQKDICCINYISVPVRYIFNFEHWNSKLCTFNNATYWVLNWYEKRLNWTCRLSSTFGISLKFENVCWKMRLLGLFYLDLPVLNVKIVLDLRATTVA